MKSQKTVLVTGSAGFIGYHVSKQLLSDGHKVIGVDCLSDYYDVGLKISREQHLRTYKYFVPIHENIETPNLMKDIFDAYTPSYVIHLAAQAGVRYSIENPRSYLETNINGTFELLEASRQFPPEHLMIASTSSAYGANNKMPYSEIDKADHQMSFYAATKKATENFAHSYSHLYNIPVTMFRFFTVYGPWGRPDMALFKFTKSMLSNEKIDVYNHGNMKRDFTYIDDICSGILGLMHCIPVPNDSDPSLSNIDSLSPVAPFRLVNIGNSTTTSLMEFIHEIEECLGLEADKNYLPMQPGDVPETCADTRLIRRLTNNVPNTPVKVGIKNFVEWYKEYYSVTL